MNLECQIGGTGWEEKKNRASLKLCLDTSQNICILGKLSFADTLIFSTAKAGRQLCSRPRAQILCNEHRTVKEFLTKGGESATFSIAGQLFKG